MFQQSANNITSKTFSVANEPAVRAHLTSRSPASLPGAIEALQQFALPKDSSSLGVELWSADHTFVLALPQGSSPGSNDLEAEFKHSATNPSKTVGTIRVG